MPCAASCRGARGRSSSSASTSTRNGALISSGGACNRMWTLRQARARRGLWQRLFRLANARSGCPSRGGHRPLAAVRAATCCRRFLRRGRNVPQSRSSTALGRLGTTHFGPASALRRGVLNGRRISPSRPRAHLSQLASLLTENGLLVLETLIAPTAFVPKARYARMRNVWLIPDTTTINHWLTTAGFTPGAVVDITPTTGAEQRTTEWMPHQSLSDALDPNDPTRTIEGHPAPHEQ